MAALALTGIGVSFGAVEVLSDVSLEVADGEFVVLVGPSGCGKSTLLRVVAGLVAPDRGEVRIGGALVNELEPAARDLAMVFQNYALYPHLSVARNLAFPLELRRVPRPAIEARVRETAASLGLLELLERKPGELSGGQMQRVALGRALIRDPQLFLFDEPLSNLDVKLRTEMRSEIARLHERSGVTSLYVTHDQAEAMTMGTRIAVLERGRVVQFGRPLDVFARPASRFVAGFIGSPAMNLSEVEVCDGRVALGTCTLSAPRSAGSRAVLGVRPHELHVERRAEDEFELDAVVDFVEALGVQTLVDLRIGERTLKASHEGHLELARGSRVALSFAASALHWFDASSGARLA